MEKLEQSQTNFVDNKNILKSNKLSSKIQIHQKCIANNVLSHFCISPKCQTITSKFMCNDQKCKCNQEHFQCIKKSIDSVLIKIDEKMGQNVKKMKVNIQQIFTKFIDEISQFQQYCLKQVDNQLKFINLTDLQLIFYSLFTEQKTQNFKQFNTQKLQKLSNINENNQDEEKSEYFFTKYMKQVYKIIQSFHQAIKLLKIKNNNIFQAKDMKSEIIKSSVIKNDFQLTNLIHFFDDKVKSIKLVFKASENDFDMQKYYQKCGHLQNTIIACENVNNKIFGGYTPLTFNPVNNRDEFVTDPTGSSFLFSLTNTDKFKLKEKQNTIRRSRDKKWIAFGYGPIFALKSQANNYQHGRFYLYYKTYENQNYSENQQSYIKLTGTKFEEFKVKEWEVFQVQFQ